MFKHFVLFLIILGIYILFETTHSYYLSENFSTLQSCEIDKKNYDIKFPNYTRSHCFSIDNGFFYTICEGNICNIPDKYIQKESTGENLDNFSQIVEQKLYSLSYQQRNQWIKQFSQNIEELKKKHKDNHKNVLTLQKVEKILSQAVNSQKDQDALCVKFYGEGAISSQTETQHTSTTQWVENHKKNSLICQLPILEEKDSEKNNEGNNKNEPKVIEFEIETEFYIENKIPTFHFQSNQNIGKKNIYLRNFSTYEYYEKNLNYYNDGEYSEKTFTFTDKSNHGIKFTTPGEWYTFEVFDADSGKIYAQYRFKFQEYEEKTDLKSQNPIRNIFDGNKNRAENYTKYLQKISQQELKDFFKNAEQEMKSKIREDSKYIYFNNTYAITKKKYYGNQIYSERKCKNGEKYCYNGNEISSVCPNGYTYELDSLHYNPYERQIIGYYLNKNKQKYKINTDPSGVLSDNAQGIKLWVWDKFDEYYVRKVDLEKIKKEAKTKDFVAHEFVFSNPGISKRKIDQYNAYHYWTDYGTLEKVGTLLPVLCENKKKNFNTAVDQFKFQRDFQGVKTITDQVNIKNGQREGSKPLLYSFALLQLEGFFGGNVQYFMPIRNEKGSINYIFLKKYLTQ